ncbi:hypothetical protein LY78DRAFT_114717 [Colletotrichum sublineola]|nr:hypothetical protein LY78DRAFT_114717 [Colletotrichum sublineola]
MLVGVSSPLASLSTATAWLFLIKTANREGVCMLVLPGAQRCISTGKMVVCPRSQRVLSFPFHMRPPLSDHSTKRCGRAGQARVRRLCTCPLGH